MKILVHFPEDYPISPPEVKVDKPKRYFHPNISDNTGKICERTVKDKNPSIKLRDRIDALSQLLTTPNPDSPLNSTAAKLFQDDYRGYFKKALRVYRGTEIM